MHFCDHGQFKMHHFITFSNIQITIQDTKSNETADPKIRLSKSQVDTITFDIKAVHVPICAWVNRATNQPKWSRLKIQEGSNKKCIFTPVQKVQLVQRVTSQILDVPKTFSPIQWYKRQSHYKVPNALLSIKILFCMHPDDTCVTGKACWEIRIRSGLRLCAKYHK